MSVTIRLLVPVSAMTEIAAAFWRPGQGMLLRPYVGRYLDLLPMLADRSPSMTRVMTVLLFPAAVAGPDLIDRIEPVLPTVTPVVRNVLRERADLFRRMLRTRG